MTAMRRALSLAATGLLLATTSPAPAQSAPKGEVPPTAFALIQELRSRKPEENTEVYGLLKNRDEKGKRSEVAVKLNVVISKESWQDIYQSQPAGDIPAQTLIVKHLDDGPNQYYLAKHSPSDPNATPRLLEPGELYTTFAGSQFWIADLGLEFFHWPAHAIVKNETRQGRSCRVVESRNPGGETGGYSKVRSWIDNETGYLLRAEAYDKQGKVLKSFSVKSVKKSRLKEIEILNEQTDARTRLEFDLEVPE